MTCLFCKLGLNGIRAKQFRAINKREASHEKNPIKKFILKHYPLATSKEGERDNSPFLLFKSFLLQKWFQIKSDPELESQINDRISFKPFLGLPIDQPSPDHLTFSRFRHQLSPLYRGGDIGVGPRHHVEIFRLMYPK